MRELTVNEIEEVNGGLAPAVWLGAFVVRYAIKKAINSKITKTAAGAIGSVIAANEGQKMGEK